MNYINKFLVFVSLVMAVSVYAGETDKAAVKNTDTQKTTITVQNKYTAVRSDTASKNIVPVKTNWSKIKDLFM